MTCPDCGADLRGEAIPRKNLHLYDGETRFSRVVALYYEEADTIVGWECPDCHHRWDRTEVLPGGYRSFNMIGVTLRKPGE
jgi:hypothetical protein